MGFSVRLDDVLPKYCELSFESYKKDFSEILKYHSQPGSMDDQQKEDAINSYAYKKTVKDLEQGLQGIECDLNTLASSRGDFPFVSVAIGLDDSFWGQEVSKAFLKVRREGQGKPGFKKPVLFPKLIFLYTEKLHGKGEKLEEVFNEAIKTSSECMYPDYVSLDAGYTGEVYEKWGAPIVPMGCRSFVSPYYPVGGVSPASEDDLPVFIGRSNFGVITLNLPMIFQKSKLENKDFYKVLDYYLDMIRKHHKKTFEYLSGKKAKTNPLMYMEGGIYGGHLNADDEIGEVLKQSTCSFGFTGLNELNLLYNGKSIIEDGEFPLEVLKYIYDEVDRFKKEDNILHSVYATPGESLVSLQVRQFREKFGDVPGVTDKEYLTNSFHCWVGEDITGVEKQDLEFRFWEYTPGGRIQYVRYDVNYNTEAIKAMVRRAMKMGFYEGVNLALGYCEDCGHQELNRNSCSKCGSSNITKIDRNCGYLSYTKVKGRSMMNDGKLAEIRDRQSM